MKFRISHYILYKDRTWGYLNEEIEARTQIEAERTVDLMIKEYKDHPVEGKEVERDFWIDTVFLDQRPNELKKIPRTFLFY